MRVTFILMQPLVFYLLLDLTFPYPVEMQICQSPPLTAVKPLSASVKREQKKVTEGITECFLSLF